SNRSLVVGAVERTISPSFPIKETLVIVTTAFKGADLGAKSIVRLPVPSLAWVGILTITARPTATIATLSLCVMATSSLEELNRASLSQHQHGLHSRIFG